MIKKKNILGVGISNATKEQILEYIIKSLENFKKKLFFVTPNPEFLVLANKNVEFKNILNKAELASADGIGVVIAAKILGKSLKGRFTGIGLVESLCKEVAKKPITVGFLGGRPGVAEKTAECLVKKYPGLKVSFVGDEWPNLPVRGPAASLPPTSAPSIFSGKPSADSVRAVGSPSSGVTPHFLESESGLPRTSNLTMEQFNNLTIDILFVAFGCPKQEFWISENLDKIPVKIAIGVGGAFDYISGKIPRAPGFIRSIGLEWLFRLILQPWRIKRQLSLLKFIWLVIKEKLKKN